MPQNLSCTAYYTASKQGIYYDDQYLPVHFTPARAEIFTIPNTTLCTYIGESFPIKCTLVEVNLKSKVILTRRLNCQRPVSTVFHILIAKCLELTLHLLQNKLRLFFS